MSKYIINKGINKPIEFKGLKAQYIGYLAAGLGFTLLGFAAAYVVGVRMYLCLAISVVLASASFIGVFQLSATYGEHGLMKKIAQKQIPDCVVMRNRKTFTKLLNI